MAHCMCMFVSACNGAHLPMYVAGCALTCRGGLPMKLLKLGLSAQLPGGGGCQEAVRSFHDPQTQALSREVASAIIGFDTRHHTACMHA